MSILLHSQIIENIKSGDIFYSGKDFKNIGSNSVDVLLYNKIKTYVPCKIIEITKKGVLHKKLVLDEIALSKMTDSENLEDFFIDVAEKNEVFEYDIPEDGIIIPTNILILGATVEACGSKKFIPMYDGRSSMARLGIQSHISAGFGDIAFEATWTLEIICVHPAKIYPNMRIGQVYFVETDDDARELLYAEKVHYQGKYTSQTGPQESKSYLDFQGSRCISRNEGLKND